MNWLFTKSHHWAYEEEIRAVKYRTAGLVGFPSEALTEIHFGLGYPQSAITEIKNALPILGYTDVALYKMEMNHSAYDLTCRKTY